MGAWVVINASWYKKRADALVAHFKALAEGRDLILAELQRAGSVYGHMMAVRS